MSEGPSLTGSFTCLGIDWSSWMLLELSRRNKQTDGIGPGAPSIHSQYGLRSGRDFQLEGEGMKE